MARRMIECKTWKSFQVGNLTFRQRCLWIGLITVADDQGRGHAHPGILIGAIFPYDEITHDELQADMDHLADLGLIHLYQNGDGAPLYQIVKWWRYQRPTWAWPSDLPAPDGWTDREKYRKGNEVIENDWDSDGGFKEGANDPAVTSSRPHSDPTPSKAPSGSTSGSNRDRDTNDGADAPATPSSGGGKPPPNLRGWLELLRSSKNKAATSRYMIATLYPYFGEEELPDYGRIGKASKRVGGWARLAQYIWGVNQHEPQGDLMSYIETVHRSGAKPTGNGKYQMEVGA